MTNNLENNPMLEYNALQARAGMLALEKSKIENELADIQAQLAVYERIFQSGYEIVPPKTSADEQAMPG